MNIETKLGVDHTYAEALGLMRLHKYGDALRMLEHVVRTDSKNIPASMNLVICYMILVENPHTKKNDSLEYIEGAISTLENALITLKDEKEAYQYP